MAATTQTIERKFNRVPSYAVGLLLMIVTALIAVFLLVLNSDLSQSFPYLFLLPWIAVLFLVLLIPSAILYKQGKFSWVNPLVVAAWSYFIPAFVLGGLFLASGMSRPYFLAYIDDPETIFPLTVTFIILGYCGLAIGYFMPFAGHSGQFLSRRLGRQFNDEEAKGYFLPGLILLALGMLNSAAGIASGILGYSQGGEVASYAALVFMSTMFVVEGIFLLWYVVFRQSKQTRLSYAIIGLLVLISILRAVFSGSRAVLVQGMIIIVFSFVLSGRLATIKQTLLITVCFFLALIIGMVYGTIYRLTSVANQGSGLDAHLTAASETFEKLGQSSNSDSLELGLNTVAERLDVLSSLAVIVSNHAQLAPYEEAYGLKDNIRNDFATTFAPRILWPEKPQIGDFIKQYGELYFDYGDNSFAMTPIGDLLRNYGVVGIFVGMLFLGIFLRVIYSVLIEGRRPTFLRATLYFMMITSVSYEAFYSLAFSYPLKIGFTSVIGLMLVYIVERQIRRHRAIRIEPITL